MDLSNLDVTPTKHLNQRAHFTLNILLPLVNSLPFFPPFFGKMSARQIPHSKQSHTFPKILYKAHGKKKKINSGESDMETPSLAYCSSVSFPQICYQRISDKLIFICKGLPFLVRLQPKKYAQVQLHYRCTTARGHSSSASEPPPA